MTIVVIMIFSYSCAPKNYSSTSKKIGYKEIKSSTDKKKIEKIVQSVVENAHKALGSPYKYGGTNTKGFDCSGLIITLFKQQDIILPHNSLQLSKTGIVLNAKKDKVNKGDLVFFSNSKNKTIDHVGIVIDTSDEEIKFIHSSTSKGVIVSSTKEPYYKKNFVQANRLF
ncbi:Murein DD-endopeptidase MepS/Murein LD-carboxypeptidase [Flavobacterium sp. CECT 9288]|uniref:C40 family peptidase n=1 Tax=Flavobacterium sp. CECT 9288 TaxID=2845819 RepID=UPI001E4B73AB|nr:C40 family peptidase [Flavobacterium sp. CECT 9288]CAH0334614.1 Murein DD-endopeptidase MepS/Murein LD-carboxypeptidase [Flavobacterium sp. CECT 9288]